MIATCYLERIGRVVLYGRGKDLSINIREPPAPIRRSAFLGAFTVKAFQVQSYSAGQGGSGKVYTIASPFHFGGWPQ